MWLCLVAGADGSTMARRVELPLLQSADTAWWAVPASDSFPSA